MKDRYSYRYSICTVSCALYVRRVHWQVYVQVVHFVQQPADVEARSPIYSRRRSTAQHFYAIKTYKQRDISTEKKISAL